MELLNDVDRRGQPRMQWIPRSRRGFILDTIGARLAYMKRFCVILVAAILTIVLGVIAWDALRSRSFQSRAGSLKIGDSKQHVEHVLGRPTEVFTPDGTMLSVRTETWAYGSNFRFREAFLSATPDFSPLTFRLFGPEDNDVIIEFDSTGLASAVRIPRTKQ